MKVLLAGCGGFLGSIARYLLGGAIHRLVQAPVFPFGTLVVNVSGCLAIGLLGGLADQRGLLSPGARVFLLIGVLGGFTTFSSFGYETFQLARDGETLLALANILLQLVLGLSAVWAGNAVIRLVWG
jgi:fluoride exporter